MAANVHRKINFRNVNFIEWIEGTNYVTVNFTGGASVKMDAADTNRARNMFNAFGDGVDPLEPDDDEN